MNAVEARLRGQHVGIAVVSLPERPVYSNDAALEARRADEYAAHEAACNAEAATWLSLIHI